MALPEIPNYPAVVSIIPASGVQFLDFGFNLVMPNGKKNEKAPDYWAFFDPRADGTKVQAQPLPTMLRRGDTVLTPGRESYEIALKELLHFTERRWIPLPLLREEPGNRYFEGPTTWARGYLVKLPQPDKKDHDYRLVVAIDTNLLPERPDTAYVAPSPEDARNGRKFSLPGRSAFYNFYLRQNWLRDWLDDSFRTMLEEEERRRSKRREVMISDQEVAEAKLGPNEPLARYVAFIDLLYQLDFLPKLTVVDAVTANLDHIDVDMVLDVGNSRTCGLLVEADPGGRSVDIGLAFKLALRDLSQPEQVYDDPFESRLEFALASFGLDNFVQRAGRSDAFTWPTIVRVGPEAVRLAGMRRGSEGRTGMSSPKRYLWDEDQSPQPWHFNGLTMDGEWGGLAAQGQFATLVNDIGQPLHLVPPEDEDGNLPSLLAKYSRSHLMTFMLAEVLQQALTMMNSPAQRLRGGRSADLPRRLRRLVLTLPAALSITERQLLKERAEAARDLVYLCNGRAARVPGEPALDWLGQPEPKIILKWDEASATQLVYLYSQIALAFSGDARAFFRAVRAGGAGRDGDSLRVATLDIGGGTTDLVITTLKAEGQGAHVTIVPSQDFRESFSLAGDDIVLAVIREVILPAFVDHVRPTLGRDRTDMLVQALFGANRGNMDAEELARRQQFATQIAAPAAVSLLGAYEGYDPLEPPPVEERPLSSLLPEGGPAAAICEAVERAVQDAGGDPNFRLLDVPIPVDMEDVGRSVRSLMTDVLRAMMEMTQRYDADLVLLSGRPSRLPAVKDIVLESGTVAPHRVIAMHEPRMAWYPFRSSDARIKDPKTTAVVGGMICLLTEGHVTNFNFRGDRMNASSVARYLGKIETSNRLPAQDVYYADLDLEDAEWQMPDHGFEFRGPMALGVRQFPQEWWPATQLYTLDYADEDTRVRLQPRTPLEVRLARTRVQRRSGAGGQAPEMNDRLEVARVDNQGPPGPGKSGKYALTLRLQTLRNRDGYWLDTGVLIDV